MITLWILIALYQPYGFTEKQKLFVDDTAYSTKERCEEVRDLAGVPADTYVCVGVTLRR